MLILGGAHCSHGGIRLLLLSLESSVTAELRPTQPGCSLKLGIHFIHHQNKKGAAGTSNEADLAAATAASQGQTSEGFNFDATDRQEPV